MYYCSMCLIVKNEAEYLAEWINYYQLIGVEHFYIYDNNSNPPLKSVLQPYIDKGLVTYHYDTRTIVQTHVYNDCIRNHGKDNTWLGFFDTDEFLVLKQHTQVRDFLQNYEQFGALSIPWYLFGSNGHERKPKSQIYAYTKHHVKSCHYKTMVRPERIKDFNIHNVNEHMPGYYTVDETKQQVSGPFTMRQCSEFAQLNHYVVRSKEEFLQKVARGGPDGSRKPPEFFDLTNNQPMVDDFTIIDNIDKYFEPFSYLLYNPDLAKISATIAFAKRHWLEHGKQEQRQFYPLIAFNWVNYVQRYPDLQQAGIDNADKAIAHYIHHGQNEGRKCD